MKRGPAIAFLGPSRPAEVPASCTVLPPARQGDVWRALERKPRAIALIDGVFEHQPSVWHRELLDALAEGVPVFGASSMGALRAAELAPYGMVPVGQIARAYCSGDLLDDADVALLHADAGHGFKPLTVPLVDARFAIERARRTRVLRPKEAARLDAAARALHYTDRTWGRLTREAGVRTPPWEAFVRRGPPSLKKLDAAACLRRLVAARLPRPAPATWGPGSSFQRRARLVATGRPIPAPTAAERAALARLAARLHIEPARDPSGLTGILHRLLHDGMLKVPTARLTLPVTDGKHRPAVLGAIAKW